MKSRIIAVTTTAVAVIALLAACSSGSGSASSLKKQDPDILTIALVTSPPTLDPALSGAGDPLSLYPDLAYSPLITMKPDGTYGPGLATSWKYVGTDNTRFDLTLRSGVVFSDGGKLTADGVKKHFAYVAKAGGPFASRAAGYTVNVTGPLSLSITLASPDPDMEYELSQRVVTGDVISPIALADPAKLGTSTAGAGQYVFDSADSVTGQTYTYTPNTKYWDQKAINWKKVVIKVIPDANATLAALKSGQVDYTLGTPQNAAAAKTAGFTLTTAATNFNQIEIFDRAGATVK
ncbi:MAG: putative transporter solute binding component, partial [Pseudonocardiales bacterium]|nr:putative transporter solute binding component [Pseudonocardiales bacterium]